MEQMRQKCALVLYIFLLTRLSITYADTCPDEDDAFGLIELGTENGTRRELGKLKNFVWYEKADLGQYTEAIAAFFDRDKIEMTLKKKIPPDVNSLMNVPAGSPDEVDIPVQYYFRTCPQKWFLLQGTHWYWKFYKRYEYYTIIQYCFTYWWVWATYCPICYCANNYYPFQYNWDPRFRCLPENRAFWLPMVCYNVYIYNDSKRGNEGSDWIPWYWRKVYVPRGCCCRKFWPFVTKSDKCPAKY